MLYCNNRSISKDAEKDIADNEAVRSNIKLLINSPRGRGRSQLQDGDGLSLESLQVLNA